MIGPGNQAVTSPLAARASLHCPVTGDPPFTIIWLKNGKEIEIDGVRTNLMQNGTLEIVDATVNSY